MHIRNLIKFNFSINSIGQNSYHQIIDVGFNLLLNQRSILNLLFIPKIGRYKSIGILVSR